MTERHTYLPTITDAKHIGFLRRLFLPGMQDQYERMPTWMVRFSSGLNTAKINRLLATYMSISNGKTLKDGKPVYTLFERFRRKQILQEIAYRRELVRLASFILEERRVIHV